MKNLLTRKNNRLNKHDYSANGWYLCTICSKNRENIFGQYINNFVGTGLAPVRHKNNIKLSTIGNIIKNNLIGIPQHYDNVGIDEYIIMPNHIHCILIIDKLREGASPSPTISTIIGSFKSKCSIEYLNYIKQNNLNLSGQIWQRSFHDHIIRNKKSLNAIRKYIEINPQNWENDIENLINL
ncbi:MAG: transposase [Candidatus Omnitrophota bacterium]